MYREILNEAVKKSEFGSWDKLEIFLKGKLNKTLARTVRNKIESLNNILKHIGLEIDLKEK